MKVNLSILILLCKDWFFELPEIKNPRAKKLATLVLMNEFDYIIREAREIFDFYGMNHEKPVIAEILYNSDYALRHLLSALVCLHNYSTGMIVFLCFN